MPDSKPLGVGIVGVGGIAVSHMAALRVMPDATLAAVCDLDLARARAVGAQEHCSSYGSIDELLADTGVEAVIVCTPNVTHEQIGHRVLTAGRHLLMEKPLAMTGEQARSLQAAATARNLRLAVGHSHRFSDQGLAIRGAIDSGAIGTPRFVRIAMNGGWIWPGWQHWVLDPALSGGHSLHNGIHLVDLASWWIGEEATSVFSAGQHATSEALSIYDYLVIELGFASGAAAVCEISRGERPRSASYLEITVVGSEGVLSREWDAEGVLAWTDNGLSAGGVDGAGARTFAREMQSFVDAARGLGDVIPPVSAAVHAVDLAVASEVSLAEGRTVTIGAAA
jgi:myo-inositol 2-dehydrogenase / D-chiro-inositol 1-dehydrogenase